MGRHEAFAWFYRQANVNYLRAYWHAEYGTGYREIGRQTIREKGQESAEFEGKDWHLNRKSPYATADGDGFTELHFLVGGEGESIEPVALGFGKQVEEMQKDRKMARMLGFTLDLAVFHVLLGRHHTEGFFGRGKLDLLFKLIAVAIIGLVVVGIAGGYFASQSRVLCITVGHDVNGTAVPVPCPASVFAPRVTTSETSRTTSQIFTQHTVSIPVINGTG